MKDTHFSYDVTSDNFSEMVLEKSAQVPVMVDFWATWCGPCQVLMPILAKLAEEYQGKFLLAKVNSDEQQELAAKFSVRSIPTIKIFRNGKVVDEFMGAQPESAIRGILERHIERESDKTRHEAALAYKNGDIETAIHLLEKAVTDDPDNTDAKLDLSRLYISHGDLDKAQAEFNTIPVNIQIETEGKKVQALLTFSMIARDVTDCKQLEQETEENNRNLDACYRLAACKALEKNYAAALEYSLAIVRKDRSFAEDGGRKSMLMIFDLIGEDHELTKIYRKKLSMYLY